jgi:alkanesulfonate monooxygenase SsuD/methylene tetrahydromethanopterin reductase-like flavin-dependent oxidoreductase (luciferase family)
MHLEFGASLRDRAVAASPSSRVRVSPVPASIPSADDTRAQAIALATSLLNDLDAAAAATDHPGALHVVSTYRAKVQKYLRWAQEGTYSTALGMLGKNGYGPGIADACRSARHYGFDWQARRAALMDSIAPAPRSVTKGVVSQSGDRS